MDSVLEISDIKSCVTQVAKDYGIERVSLFGSYANGKRNKDSDIDLLVGFGPRPVSLFKVGGFKAELEELTGKEVDVVPLPISADSLLVIDNEVLLYER